MWRRHGQRGPAAGYLLVGPLERLVEKDGEHYAPQTCILCARIHSRSKTLRRRGPSTYGVEDHALEAGCVSRSLAALTQSAPLIRPAPAGRALGRLVVVLQHDHGPDNVRYQLQSLRAGFACFTSFNMSGTLQVSAYAGSVRRLRTSANTFATPGTCKTTCGS